MPEQIPLMVDAVTQELRQFASDETIPQRQLLAALQVALTGLVTSNTSGVLASDTILQALGKLQAQASNKVDKVAGKSLSTEDYTTAEKTKLSGIATGATANATDANLRDRTTHTGTQAISTVTGLQTALDTKAPASHTHDATSITSGVLADARLPARLRAIPQTVTDWDTAVGSGWYQGNGAANAPSTGNFIGNVECHHDRWVTQVVHSFNTDSASDTKTYRRESSDSNGTAVWGPWYRLRLSEAEQDALRQAWWGSTAVPISKVTNLQTALDSKVDKVAGKSLSTEDYTTAEKTKLSGIATGATANATDANLRDRTTHTGTQSITTITGVVGTMAGGAIIERGSNASGEYVRFADGTQICLKTHQLSTPIATQLGASYYSPSQDLGAYAAAFVGPLPRVSAASSSNSGLTYPTLGNIGSLSSWPVLYFSSPSSTTELLTVFLTAIGRWK